MRIFVLFNRLRLNDHSINWTERPVRRQSPLSPILDVQRPDMTHTLSAPVQRKVIRRIVPILMLMYTMAYLDRINIGTAALRMNAELGITQQVFGLAAGLFFVGYLAMEIPSNIILHRIGARIWLTRIMVTWGLISACTAFVQNGWQLIAIRMLLGVAEAGLFPGLIYCLALWFPPNLRGRMLVIAVLPWAVIVGTPASAAIVQYADGLFGFSGWRIMLFVEGLLPVLLGFYSARYLTSKPEEADWLTDDEKREVIAAREPEAGSDPTVAEPALRTTLCQPHLVLLSIAYATAQMGFYASLIFTPQIVQEFGRLFGTTLSTVQVGLLSAIPSVIGMVIYWFWIAHSDKQGERVWHAIAAFVTAALGIGILLGVQSLYASILGLALLTAGLVSGPICIWQLTGIGVRGKTAAVVFAYVNCFGILGSMFSPYLIGLLKDRTGSYDAGLTFLAVAALSGAVLVFVAGRLMVRKGLLRPADEAVVARHGAVVR
jgi:ACS family tartrate transporter-like MFS transporter